MTAAATRVWQLIEPALAEAGFELVDVECVALGSALATVRVRVDHLAPVGPVDLEAIAAATRVVDAVLEASDPIDGRYTLEVSSPGLERPLRTPAQFRRFVGTTVRVKTTPEAAGERRVEGPLEAADEDRIVVAGRPVRFEHIERAHTVFVWGPAEKPGKGAKSVKHAKQTEGAKSGKGAGRTSGAGGDPVTSNDNEANEVTVR